MSNGTRRGADDPTTVIEVPHGAAADRALAGNELAPGSRAGDYLVQATIASGGCGIVYAAEHRVLRRRAAVKVLHRDLAASPELVQRFEREARVVNQIGHPNIVDIYDFGYLDDGRPYFVMELLTGTNLSQLLQR